MVIDARAFHLRPRNAIALLTVLVSCAMARAQSLESQLDDDAFVRGLIELQLPEVLQHYIELHPPATEVQGKEQQIALTRLLFIAGSTDPAQRMQGIERVLDIRRKLIRLYPNDPRRTIWMADQATDLLFDYLSADGAGLTALFGHPAPEQRERAQRAASEIRELADKADVSIGQAIVDLESSPGFAQNFALQQRRRDLADRERDRRIPFLRGVGAVLHAELNVSDATERTKLYEAAVRVLQPLLDTLEGTAATQARLYTALAQARLGQFDAAEAMFAKVAADTKASPADAFAARMGGVINRTIRGGPQAGLEALNSIEPKYVGTDALFYRVLIADQRFLLRRQLAQQAAPDQRNALMAQAFAAYTDLLKAPGSARETVRAIVFSRLSNAADGSTPPDQLPPLVAIAQADGLSKDPQTREQAILILEQLLGRAKLEDSDHAAALFALARALFDHGQHLFAAQRFVELAKLHPTDSQADRSIELGVTIASDLHRRDPSDEDAHRALRAGLDLLLERYVNLPTIDRWRYAAAKLALEEDRFDEAQKLFAQLAPDSPDWLDAHFMQAVVARTRASKMDDPAQRAKFNELTLAIIDRVQPVIEGGLKSPDTVRAADLKYYLGSLRVFRAEALLDLNRAPQAIEILQTMEADSSNDPALIGQALRVRIKAYQAMKRPDDALREIERFVQGWPDQVPAAMGPMLAGMQQDVSQLVESGQEDQALELGQRTLLPAAQILEKWMNSTKATPDSAALVPRLADAYRLSGKFEDGLRWYGRALVERPDDSRLLLGRAECLFHLAGETNLGDAMGIYKRIAASGPESGKDNYWLAQLRMLQIIDQVDRHTEQILPRIERLRQQDRELGGERFRRGFDALRSKHVR